MRPDPYKIINLSISFKIDIHVKRILNLYQLMNVVRFQFTANFKYLQHSVHK